MYCPKCSSPATENQRFCRQCGTNLGVILDAMDGKRSPVDFEKLKGDLKELGNSLRAGFEQAHEEIKKNNKVDWRQQRHQFRRRNRDLSNTVSTAVKDVVTETKAAVLSTPEIKNLIESKKNRWYKTSRQYHFQQAILKILSGGALVGAWYFLLNSAANTGLLQGIEKIILQHQPELIGAAPFLQMLWVLGLIPVAQGIGHVIAGSFAPNLEKLLAAQSVPTPSIPVAPQPIYTPNATSEIPVNFSDNFSITEEDTVPLVRPERQAN
jgi:hypothetical protein